ncbi:MAG: nitroreductase family protein [Thermodesulfobacteriota bacterium]|nr:nitroreductase family protein [Thermodesulfobacteriota bacterium]
MDIYKIIKERRSIRKYSAKDVTNDDLNKILEAAGWAPSWVNTQCWEFIVVRDKNIKEALSNTLSRGNPSKDAVKDAPIVIVACARKGLTGFYKGKAVTDKGDWLLFDVALAVENLTLTSHALGLGTVIVGAFDSVKTAEIVKLPDELVVVSLIPIGYPDENPTPPSRKKLKEIVSFNYYGEKE